MNYILFSLSLFFVLTSCSNSYYREKHQINAIATDEFQSAESPQLICRLLTQQEKLKFGLDSPLKFYVIDAKGLCAGDQFVLYMIRQDGSINCIGDFVVSNQLKLVSLKENIPLTNFPLNFGGFMKGETISFALECQNKDFILKVTETPNPIENEWNDGAKVKICSLNKEMEMFSLVGIEFIPNEPIRFISKSWDEMIEKELIVNSDGRFLMTVAPMVQGKDGGVNQITLERLRTGEKRSLTIPYGSVATKKQSQ